MKKTAAIALVACIAMVVMTAGSALADVLKVSLVPWDGYEGPGRGFVIFSNSTNPANNLHITVSLKGADPSEIGPVQEVWLRYDTDTNPMDPMYTAIGTLTLNKNGNGTCHINMSVPPGGTYSFWLGFYTLGGPPASWFVSEYDVPFPTLDFK